MSIFRDTYPSMSNATPEYLAPLSGIRNSLIEWASALQEIETNMRSRIAANNIPIEFDAAAFREFSDEIRQHICEILKETLRAICIADQAFEQCIPRNPKKEIPRAIEDFQHNVMQRMKLEAVIEDVTDASEDEKNSGLAASLYNPFCVVLAFLKQTYTHLQHYAVVLHDRSESLQMPAIVGAIKTCIDARQGTYGSTALKRPHQTFPEDRRVPAHINVHTSEDVMLQWTEAELIELMYFFVGNATRAIDDVFIDTTTGEYLRNDALQLSVDIDVIQREGVKFLAIEIYNGGTGGINLDQIRENLKKIPASLLTEYTAHNPSSKIERAARALRKGSPQVDVSAIGATDTLFIRSATKSSGNARASSGIGLSIASEMVHEHRGEILLTNHNNGVCVTVLLPFDADRNEKFELLLIAAALKEALRTGEVILPRHTRECDPSSPTENVSAL